jgi:hypothetical protein
MRRPLKNAQRQIAMVLLGMIIERQRLLAICRLSRVIQIKDKSGRRGGVAGDEMIHQGPSEPLAILPVALVLQARARWGTGEIVGRVPGRPLAPEFAHGGTAEALGGIGVGIPRGDLIDALGQQVPYGMTNIGLMPLIMDGGGEALGQANLPVNTPEPEGSNVCGPGAPLEIGPDGLSGDGRKTQLFWATIGHKQTSGGFSGMVVSHLPF